MPEDGKKKNLFIQEQIRKKPFYKKKEFQKTVQGLGMAVVFGVSSGLVFAAVQPWALNYFGETDKMVVVDQSESAEGSTLATEFEKPCPDTVVEKQELNLADYEKLYDEMAQVTKKGQNAIVTVTGLTNELDLFNNVNESSNKATGLVISKAGGNMMILTESYAVENAEDIKVTFCDGIIADAQLQSADKITDLAVLKVQFKELEDSTLNQVEAAPFGTSASVQIGDPIIALGVDYLSFGMVTSKPYLDICDGSYRQINTDIVGKTENGGVLLNLDGQVVGILGPESKSSDTITTLNGVGITEIGNLVNGLANKQIFPYFGIVGKPVTDAIADELSMPKGVVIIQVDEDSPAMEKGIQATDVISGINGAAVESMQDYMVIMRSLDPGDTVSVDLWRKGMNQYRETKVEITLSKR